MIAVWSVSCAAVSPADITACSVGVDRQDFSWFVLYAGRRAASRASSMVERAIKIFHLSSHIGKVSRSASRSNGGGDPYGLPTGAAAATAAAAAAAAANAVAILLLSKLDGACLARVWDNQNQDLAQLLAAPPLLN
ncbi:hypothetical protein OUZ56_012106 [Daphnia magna]|uniref:Uncharacterized protein n=1 Tax=Daphnia magna TaxID=35525 RepID=A0ABQ9Z216_9CRUS|nr:hypothetical protein OUZ56_012106 [Daphnia magna]